MTGRGRLLLGAAAATVAAGLGGTWLRGRAEPGTIPAAGVPRFAVERSRLVRKVAAEGHLAAVQATPLVVPVDAPGMQRIAWMAPDGALVEPGQVVIRFDPTDLESRLADGRADLEIAARKIDQALGEAGAEERKARLDADLAGRALAQAEEFASRDPRLHSRHDIIDSEIDRELARAQAENARSRGEAAAGQGRAELELLRIEKHKAELAIERAEKGLASLTVAAPHGGMLVLERNWRGERPRAGDPVWPGQKLAEIPDPARMQVRAHVLEADAGGLRAGCRALLTVESHPDRTYPATVERVDALAKTLHENVPVQYFEAVLVPDETDARTMKPGQRARAEIVLEEIDAALSIPPQAVFHEEGRDLAFRRVGRRLEPTPLTLGARSPSRVQVLAGLAAGDEVALRDPRRPAGELTGAGSEPGAAPAARPGGVP